MKSAIAKIIEDDVCEIFNSWQGEGIDVGKPCTFIRFNKCNLDCDFCDTKKKLDIKCSDITPQDLTNLVSETRHIVFTGGEPSLFTNQIVQLLEWVYSGLSREDLTVTIETNGTLMGPLTQTLHELKFDKYNISFKFAISPKRLEDIVYVVSYLYSPHGREIRWTPWISGVCFKVVAHKGDLPQEILKSLLSEGVPRTDIFVMVEGKNKTEIGRNKKKAINLAKKFNVGICARDHILLNYP